MDKDALRLAVANAICKVASDGATMPGADHWTDWISEADAAFAALGANGYVVVPEPLLKELLSLSPTNHNEADRYHYARRALAAAVVEAVGPTT